MCLIVTMESSRLTSTAGSNTAITQIINPSKNTEMKCCPINYTFKKKKKKFTVLILRNMINGKHTLFPYTTLFRSDRKSVV